MRKVESGGKHECFSIEDEAYVDQGKVWVRKVATGGTTRSELMSIWRHNNSSSSILVANFRIRQGVNLNKGAGSDALEHGRCWPRAACLPISTHRPTRSSFHVPSHSWASSKARNAPQMASSPCCHKNERLPENNTRANTSNSSLTSQHCLIFMSNENFCPRELDPHQLHES
jgi:hypothetical protein